MDKQIIESKINELIEDYNLTFVNNEDNIADKKSKLIELLTKCLNENRTVSKYENWIQKSVLEIFNQNINSFREIDIDKNNNYVEYIMTKYGEKYGAIILMFNKCIIDIVNHGVED